GRSNQYSSTGSSRPISSTPSSDTWPRASPRSAPRIPQRKYISSKQLVAIYLVERVELAQGADHLFLYVLSNSQWSHTNCTCLEPEPAPSRRARVAACSNGSFPESRQLFYGAG